MGIPEIGKTTLVKRITNNWNVLDRVYMPRTEGIEMKIWKPSELDNTIIYFWDFAGQEIYYTTHQFFLSSNNINIIVFDCNKSFKENKLLFWLNTLQARAPGSPLLFIGTFIDKFQMNGLIEKVLNLSKQIEEFLSNWKLSISPSQQLKIQRCIWKGEKIIFWPINSRGNRKHIKPLCEKN
jgi:GTPase SAR1 family protein